ALARWAIFSLASRLGQHALTPWATFLSPLRGETIHSHLIDLLEGNGDFNPTFGSGAGRGSYAVQTQRPADATATAESSRQSSSSPPTAVSIPFRIPPSFPRSSHPAGLPMPRRVLPTFLSRARAASLHRKMDLPCRPHHRSR